MKDKQTPLRIYSFSHPLMLTEWLSILGNKYLETLPFAWEITNDYKNSDVVIWDGVITSKNRGLIETMLPDFKASKILLLMGESMTLFRDHPAVKFVDTSELKFVEVSGWSILPEEILSALETCYQKLKNV